MIGNDIIDLKAARTESNWKRKGFLGKLFTVSEQSMIQHSEDPETKVWELWSRKEAAYKIYNRQTKIRAFMPLRVECSDVYENANRLYGTVTIEGMTFFYRDQRNARMH